MEFLVNKFESYVFSFMEEMRLISSFKKGIVAVSGGLDSMALLTILAKYKTLSIEALHINHGTRPENKREENLVLSLCQKLNIKCHVINLKMDLSKNNFENSARLERQKIFKKFIKKSYWVYTAHHLDDSFEWSLMQSLKQSSIKSTLGIPVFNNGLARPFLSVTKNQIYNYARATNLIWLEDQSNKNLKFERNAMRRLIILKIKKRYPSYLRHYVSRQNQLAHLLNVHRLNFAPELKIISETSHSVEMHAKDFRFHKEKIREYLHKFSLKKRGEIEKELEKLIECHRNNKKSKMHGPFSFSGGVKAYLLQDHLFICHQSHLDFYQKLDLFFSQNPAQIQRAFFPHLIILDKKNVKYKSKLVHPLLPKTAQILKEQNIPYTFLPLQAELLD